MNKLSGNLLVQQDLQEVVKRINSRMADALRMFAQKRSRDHFEQIFFNRFKTFTTSVLTDLEEDVYPLIVNIYEEIDQLYWYLKSTEDMPSLVNTKVAAYLKTMNLNYGKILDLLISNRLLDKEGELLDDQIDLGENQNYENVDSEFPSENDIKLNDLGEMNEGLSFTDDFINEDLANNGDLFESTNAELPPPFFEDGKNK